MGGKERRRSRSGSDTREKDRTTRRHKHGDSKVSSRYYQNYEHRNAHQESGERKRYQANFDDRFYEKSDGDRSKTSRSKSRSPSSSRNSDSDSRNRRRRDRKRRDSHLRERSEAGSKDRLKSKFELKRERLKVDVSGRSAQQPPVPATATNLVQELEKRKLIFNKKPAEVTASTSSLWEATKFSGDSDGKMQAKFKRLMGIKEDFASSPDPAKNAPDGEKRDEYLANLEKQYEVARVATHTQRGLGLGFSSGMDRLPS